MNITCEKAGVSAEITVSVDKADYAENVEKELKAFRRKASLPGFRPGQAPMGMIRKRFANDIALEQLNRTVGEKLYAYINDEKLQVLGDPLPSVTREVKIDLDGTSELTFDVALAPELNTELTSKDTLTAYRVTVSDEMVDAQVQEHARRRGEYKEVDAYEAGDMVKGLMQELDADGNVKEGGISVEDAIMLPNYFRNDEQKAKFEGAKKGDAVVFSPYEAYAGSEVELGSLLKIEKEKVAEAKGNFSFTVEGLTRHVAAPIDQQLFNSVYADGSVASEEDFRSRIKSDIEGQFATDTDFKFIKDLRAYLEQRLGEVAYADDLMKRIMKANSTDKTDEYIEQNYAPSVKELTWQLVRDQLAKQFDVKVERDDVMAVAKTMASMQFAQYGMVGLQDEIISKYAEQMLQNKEQGEFLVIRAIEQKIGEGAKKVCTIDEKAVTAEEFHKLMSGQA